jgi:hypothetical protein
MKPPRPPDIDIPLERRAMALAVEYLTNGESSAWLAAPELDRTGALHLIEQGRSRREE